MVLSKGDSERSERKFDDSTFAGNCGSSAASVSTSLIEADTPSTLADTSPRREEDFHDFGDDEGLRTADESVHPSISNDKEEDFSSTFTLDEVPATHRAFIIFDWDDTILPTTTLRNCSRPASPTMSPNQLAWGLILDAPELNAELLTQFEELSALCAETIELTSRFGELCFITNGSLDWIRTSCLKYMPSLWPRVCHIKRVSAKDLVQTQSRDPLQWKKQTFCMELNEHLKNKFQPDEYKVVISVGDSLHERHALYHFFDTTSLPRVCIRSIKFISLPDVPKLIAQHLALRAHFPVIASISRYCRCADLRYHFSFGDGSRRNLNYDSTMETEVFDADDEAAVFLDDEVDDCSSADSDADTSGDTAQVVPSIEAVVFPLVRDCGGILPGTPEVTIVTSKRPGDAVAVRDIPLPAAFPTVASSPDCAVKDGVVLPRCSSEEFTLPCKLSRIETEIPSMSVSSSASVDTSLEEDEEDRSTQSVMSSLFTRASMSISRMLGRGSMSTPSNARRPLLESNPFALTPSVKAAVRAPAKTTVRLSHGNPCLFAHVSGFKFEASYFPTASTEAQ
eukprot:Gregarina_sp_Poly_1__9943@NODE_656_length_6918_cov_257_889943_g498_i0_p1_GENE_NODE_656_length_6918_cov_257_889943_g498_i0NODE_656_length_6918_cov_257_889943_g498_i0_p1_ORF_typecomplete_len567_score70_09_NODE_656_length_6918_cov_257_889943_g498_i035085208